MYVVHLIRQPFKYCPNLFGKCRSRNTPNRCSKIFCGIAFEKMEGPKEMGLLNICKSSQIFFPHEGHHNWMGSQQRHPLSVGILSQFTLKQNNEVVVHLELSKQKCTCIFSFRQESELLFCRKHSGSLSFEQDTVNSRYHQKLGFHKPIRFEAMSTIVGSNFFGFEGLMS